MKTKLPLLFITILNLLSISPSLSAQQSHSQTFKVPATYDYIYFEEMVPGGDGHNLFTRIYLPKGDGPWPVVVTRTPYVFQGKGDNNPLGREYAKRGIGYIQQDCRGKGASEGFYSPNIYERKDGIALYEWMARQEWCRSIGIFGTSYTALTAWLVADSMPKEKFKGMYVSHYGVDRHISCYRAGLFRQDIMSGWVIDNAEEAIKKPAREDGQAIGENYYDFYRYIPQVEADSAVLGQKLPYYRDWITHTDYSDPYWNTGVWADLKSIPYEVDVPVTIVAGQFDHHEEGTILAYERLMPETKKNSRLILGSWNHSFQVTPTHVPTEHSKDFNITADQFEWFYELLVNKHVPKPEIKAYVIEDDRWITLDEWPVKSDSDKKLYLTSKHKEKNVFILDDSKDICGENLSYLYNPENPVIATGGETIFTSISRRGSNSQPPAGYREDVLSFVSAPLTEDMTIAGTIKLVLNVSSDVDDTAFAFTLSEITPDGVTYNMRTSITTLGYRNDLLGNRQDYTPGEKVQIEIVALPVIWSVKKGNALRVDVMSSNFPEYAIHSNYAGVWANQAKTRIATQQVYLGEGEGSYLKLPLLKK